MITTELCAYTRAACDVARRCGVSRIELCSAPLEGGTTPSAALLRYARSLGGVRLSVMIRPRAGDFLYTDDEVELMAAEIRFARECGADGVVLGLLTADGEVDVERTTCLVREAGPLEVTFHRASDMVRDPQRALEALIACGCRRVMFVPMGQFEAAYQSYHSMMNFFGLNQLLCGKYGLVMPIVDTDERRQDRGAFCAKYAAGRPYFMIRAKSPQLVFDEIDKLMDQLHLN